MQQTLSLTLEPEIALDDAVLHQYIQKSFLKTNDEYEFKCNICNHLFKTACSSISYGGCWCPYCVNKKICGEIECNMCIQKSFLSSVRAYNWDYFINILGY